MIRWSNIKQNILYTYYISDLWKETKDQKGYTGEILHERDREGEN